MLPIPHTFFKAHYVDGRGFPYKPGNRPSSEPSLLMLLGLFAHGLEPGMTARIAAWVQSYQNADGSIGLEPELAAEGRWNTALFIIAMHHLGLTEPRDRAVKYLSDLKSLTLEETPGVDLDGRLVGWPWREGAFGWVEPTAWAMLALRLTGHGVEPRVEAGRAFLRDRLIPGGGWNYGNKAVHHAQLLPFLDTTALAIMALGEPDRDDTAPLRDLLKKGAAETPTLYSLAWASLCLEAFGEEVGVLREKIPPLLEPDDPEEVNFAHVGLGLLALASKKVLTG